MSWANDAAEGIVKAAADHDDEDEEEEEDVEAAAGVGIKNKESVENIRTGKKSRMDLARTNKKKNTHTLLCY